jgi:predicted Zn-dependent protease
MLMVADSLRKAKRHSDAIRLLEYGQRTLPYDGELVNYLAGLYADAGRMDDLKKVIADPSIQNPKWMTVLLGRQLRAAKKYQEAEATLNQVFLADPTDRAAFEELTSLYSDQENYGSLRTTLDIWIQANPNDTAMQNIRRELVRFMSTQKGDTTGR